MENMLFVAGQWDHVFVLLEVLEANRAGFVSSIFVDIESGMDEVSYEAIVCGGPVRSLCLTRRPYQYWNEDAHEAGETAALEHLAVAYDNKKHHYHPQVVALGFALVLRAVEDYVSVDQPPRLKQKHDEVKSGEGHAASAVSLDVVQ